VFAPPRTVTDGVINGVTGAVVKWKSKYFVLTASHVLSEYEMSKDEALKVGSTIVSAQMEIPVPKDDELVLLAGYPKALRKVTADGVIEESPFRAMYRVTDIRYGCSHCYFDCKIDEREEEFVRLNDPLPEPDMDMGGLSGGPTFLVAGKLIIHPVLVGVVSGIVSQSLGGFRHLRIASLKNVKV
jgi:hypothetical protein